MCLATCELCILLIVRGQAQIHRHAILHQILFSVAEFKPAFCQSLTVRLLGSAAPVSKYKPKILSEPVPTIRCHVIRAPVR
jgi:hypothetical protein